MSIQFLCACGKRLRAKDESAGRKVVCPSCRSGLIIPPSAEVQSAATPNLGIKLTVEPIQQDEMKAVGRARSGGRLLPKLTLLAFTVVVFPIVTLLVFALFFAPGRSVEIRDNTRQAEGKGLADGEEGDPRPTLAEFRESLRPLANLQGRDGRQGFDKRRWIGWKGGVERLTPRPGLSRSASVPAKKEGETLRVGASVIIADDFDESDPGRDVMVASGFVELSELFRPGLEHLEKAARFAREDRIFSVPRGTEARIISLKSFEGLWAGHQAVCIELGDGGERAWVPDAHVRTIRP